MKTRITIIEDDDDLRGLVRAVLQAAGYEVVALSDGNEVAGKATAAHLFIIDLDLGGISGLEICRMIKSRKYTEIAPIVFIISANPDLKELAAEACADDTLSKPFTIGELLKKISEYFPEEAPMAEHFE